MNKRVVIVFSVFILFSTLLTLRLLELSSSKKYSTAAINQSTYTITVNSTRGRIYDCNLKPLAGGKKEFKAVTASDQQSLLKLKRYLNPTQFESLREKILTGYPFCFSVKDAKLSESGIKVLKTEQRYSGYYPAVHTIGYLDNNQKNGLTGLENAYNDWLNDASGEVTATFRVDAKGGLLSGYDVIINDTTENSRQGIVTTIDIDIQQIAEKAASKYLKKGAVIVTEIPTGEIRAIVSLPGFSPDKIEQALNAENSPLINRAYASYDVGSVFKLVTAAAALDYGIPANTQFECTGALQIGNNTFTCSNHTTHGILNLEGAICYSCNLYFIQLAQQVGSDRLLHTAKQLGFGQSLNVAENINTSSGKLPSEEKLSLPAGLANFSFGQGELLANPLQIASLINTIASNGMKYEPYLVTKTVDKAGKTVAFRDCSKAVQVINESTAKKISDCMKTAVLEGTASPGFSKKITAAAKTGTAETGMLEDGKKCFRLGMQVFPVEQPKYVCVVLAENGAAGGKTAGPVFKEIAEALAVTIK